MIDDVEIRSNLLGASCAGHYCQSASDDYGDKFASCDVKQVCICMFHGFGDWGVRIHMQRRIAPKANSGFDIDVEKC